MRTPAPSEVTRKAAHWVVQLRSADRPASTECDFADWLRESPVHVAEYLRAIEVWEALSHSDVDGASTVESLTREARQSVSTRLPVAPPPLPFAAGRRTRHYGRLGAAAMCAVMILAAGWFGWRHFAALDFATGMGEQRSAVLSDGSIIELNTQTEVRVVYSASRRRIDLVRGEAFFQVAKNPARPFVVFTDLAAATAVGTRFSVYKAAKGTIVTVEEGRVLVRNIPHGPDVAEETQQAPGVELDPGTQAEARPSRPVLTHRTDLVRSLAWRQRRLVFDGAPLSEVLEEFNRYNAVPLVLTDARLGDRRISGVFGANDPESLIDFLTKVDHIPVHRSDPRAVRLGEEAP